MRVLIDICHPAHVHFFLHPIRELQDRGHEVLITSRDKEIAAPLLDVLGLSHRPLSSERSGILGLATELWQRDRALIRVVREFSPDIMAAIGGIFIAHAGRFTGTPSVVFYDTENARLQNLLTYPFASRVVVPECYEGWLPKRHLRYRGYHELSYLHPDLFRPDRDRAVANGLAPQGDTFIIRIVAWKANHDIGERGWSPELLRHVVAGLSRRGTVLISAEGDLPEDMERYRYRGRPHELHHVLAFSRLFVGESATMASECAVLGTPAIYAAKTGRGYTNEQERRYGLVRNVPQLEATSIDSAVDEMLSHAPEKWARAQAELLDDTIAVAPFVADCIENHQMHTSHSRG